MKQLKKYIPFGVLLLLFIFPAAASAQDLGGSGKVVMGGSFTLQSGERLSGDLSVFGGAVSLEEGSRVSGDVLQIGGSLNVAGEIDGSIILLGGSMDLEGTAVVHGDFAHIGGGLQRSPGAEVMGQEVSEMDLSGILSLPGIVGSQGPLSDLLDSGDIGSLGTSIIPEIVVPRLSLGRTLDLGDVYPNVGLFSAGDSFSWLLSMLLRAFAYAILASLAVLFLEKPAERVRQAAVVQPFLAGGLGLVTLVLAVPVLSILAITIILLPVSFFLFLVVLVLGIFGWIAVGMEVGRRIGTMFGKSWHPALAAGVGVLILMIARAALSAIPCVDGIFTILVASVGIGGLWLTRIGTRDYQNPADLTMVES